MATRSTRAVVLTALAGVAAGFLVFFGITALLGSGSAKSNVGDDVFKVGKAKEQAQIVHRHGPLLFADPLQQGRDIYINHLGENRWVAFNVHPPDQPKSCGVKWEQRERVFRDSCAGRAYPADGDGLIRYNTYIEKDGDLVVDLRQPLAG